MPVSHINVGLLSHRTSIPVLVLKVESPGLMWVQLKYNQKRIAEVHEELRWLMGRRASQYTLFPDGIAIDVLVAVRDEAAWFRGRVTAVTNDTVAVFLGDWGRTVRRSIQEIFQLPEEVHSMPWQAIPCGLHGIRPIGNTLIWPKKSRELARLLAEDEEGKMIIKRAVNIRAATVKLEIPRANGMCPTSLKIELANLGQARYTTDHTIRAFPCI